MGIRLTSAFECKTRLPKRHPFKMGWGFEGGGKGKSEGAEAEGHGEVDEESRKRKGQPKQGETDSKERERVPGLAAICPPQMCQIQLVTVRC